MKMKKSQLKEAIKAITRECLNERAETPEKPEKPEKKPEKKAEKPSEPKPKKKAAPKKDAGAETPDVGAPDEKSPGYSSADETKLIKVLDHIADILLSFNDEDGGEVPEEPTAFGGGEEVPSEEPPVEEPAAFGGEEEPPVEEPVEDEPTDECGVCENQRPTLPPHKGSYKVVAPHAYTNTGENEPLTIQTDPEVNEGDDHWIQGAVKHPGRCAHMGSSECPEGSPQYNLAKRFKGGDIHKDNLNKECGACDEAGMTSEFGGGDNSEKIKLLKVVKHIASKLLAMGNGGEPELQNVAGDEGERLGFGGQEEGPEDEPIEGPGQEMDSADQSPFGQNDDGGDESSEEIPFKQNSKKEADPTEFTKKLAKEAAYKVQKRSYRVSNDTPWADPKNLTDPNVPSA